MTVLLVLMLIGFVISCLFLILVILGQEGKGGGLSGLGGGASGALGDTLGASAAESTLRRWTCYAATLFIVLSLGLTLVGSHVFPPESLFGEGGGPGTEEPAMMTTDVPTSPTAAPDETPGAEVEPIGPPADTPPEPTATPPAVPPVTDTPSSPPQ